jgi:hypothetical protein
MWHENSFDELTGSINPAVGGEPRSGTLHATGKVSDTDKVNATGKVNAADMLDEIWRSKRTVTYAWISLKRNWQTVNEEISKTSWKVKSKRG